MRVIGRLIVLLLLIGIVGTAALLAGSLLSLDWQHQHRVQTAALPLLDGNARDGLVRVAGQRNHIDGPFEYHELKAGHWLMEEATDSDDATILGYLQAVDMNGGIH